PRTAAEIVPAAELLLLSMQRSALAQAAALLVPERGSSRWLDPLLYGGRRPWLLASTLAISALRARFRAGRLPPLGAPPPVRPLWSIATLLLGPAAFATGCCIERRRRYAAPRDVGPDAPPRIVSLASAGTLEGTDAPCIRPIARS